MLELLTEQETHKLRQHGPECLSWLSNTHVHMLVTRQSGAAQLIDQSPPHTRKDMMDTYNQSPKSHIAGLQMHGGGGRGGAQTCVSEKIDIR